MTAAPDRRRVLRWAMTVALAPPLATRAFAARAPAGRRIEPPAGPMTFVRRLERGLPGGNKLVVTRSFGVRFVPTQSGWNLTGSQFDVTVDAPDRIAALAALERRRVETGLFPLTLGPSGLILDGPQAQPTKELDEAIAIVRHELDRAGPAAGERAKLDAFIRAVHDAGAKMTSRLPDDLFAPRDPATRAERELALPGGGAGTIAVSFTALTDLATGLMRQARREIVTAIADDRRLTREDWTLGLA